jgi:hypothetical protein
MNTVKTEGEGEGEGGGENRRVHVLFRENTDAVDRRKDGAH